jgi:glycerate kinase
MHILIAPNAFKNSLAAADVALAVQQGLIDSKLNCTTECFPIADGGDGTGALIVDRCKGEFIQHQVHDPLGRLIGSHFGLIDDGKTAVIEMADASGLRLLNRDELDPLNASSSGTGELIRLALDKGVDRIIVCLGGSATVDGGCGILHALGIRFLNAEGIILRPVPESLAELAGIDTTRLDQRILTCEVIVLCDVNNSLLGPQGSAAVFGPQKGASPADVIRLENFLVRLNDVVERDFAKSMANLKYGGTAGGAAAGLHVFLNAKLVNGIEYFLQLTGFEDALKRCDLVITGEGSIDAQTLQGKGPFGVARAAKLHQKMVIGIAGSVPLEQDPGFQQYFDVLMAIGNQPCAIVDALQNTKTNLIRTAGVIGDLLALR